MKGAILLALLALTACTDSNADLGRPPSVRVVSLARRVPVGWNGVPDRVALMEALAALGGSTEISADVTAMGATALAATTAALVGVGIDPDRVHVAPAGTGLPGLVLTSAHAVTQSCDLAWRTGWLGDAASSTDSIGRCVQDNNLAEMLADPMDLLRAPTPQPGSGERAARAVRVLNRGGQSLPASELSTQAPANGLTGGSGTPTPAAAATTTQTNPLLGGLATTP